MNIFRNTILAVSMIRLLAIIILAALQAGCQLPKEEVRNGEPDQTAHRIREGRAATTQAFQALERGEVDGFLDQMKAATRLRPAHPTLEYYLARAYIMNGDTLAALQTIKGLAEMGVAANLDDPQLAGLRAWPEGRAIESKLIENGTPVVLSERVFMGSDRDYQAEGILRYQSRWLLASVHKRRVAWGDGDLLADTGFRSAMGMKRNGTDLWLGATATQEGGAQPDQTGFGALVQIDLDSGRVLSVFEPQDTLSHWFGDLELDPQGRVFVSDSNAPGVYVLEGESLAPVAVGDPFTSPQGLVFVDGKLYVADYAAGIFELDPSTGAARLLQSPTGVTLLGIDGMAVHRGALIAIQNGMIPPRVIRIELKTPSEIGAVTTLETNHPDYSDPTLGFVENDTLFYMANSQWPLFGATADSTSRKPPVILGLPLGGGNPQ